MVNKQLREDLLKAMGGITPRRLNQIASARAQELLISHEQAVQTIAHEHGLKLGKYLNEEEQSELRPVIAHLKQTTAPPANASVAPKPKSTSRKRVLVMFSVPMCRRCRA